MRTRSLVPIALCLATLTGSALALEDAQDRKRLLTLDNGQVLRVRSRQAEGVWQKREGGSWVALGDLEVTEARLEREVLAEGRRRAEAVGRSDPDGRVEVARWMVEQGLYPEGIGELDKVLGAVPDHAAVLGLIESEWIPLELSDEARQAKALEIRELINTGIRASAATREVAVRRLADQSPFVNLHELVRAELTVSHSPRREFAVLMARRLFPRELTRELAVRTILDKNESIRAAAALALGDADSVAVIAPAITALNSRHTAVRANAAEALGGMGYLAAVEPLVANLAALQSGGGPTIGHRAHVYIGKQDAYVMDYDVEIAQAASIADPILGVQDSGSILDVRAAVQMTIHVEMRKTMSSLRRLTGQKLGDSPEEWADWWEEHRSRWRSLDHALEGTRVGDSLPGD